MTPTDPAVTPFQLLQVRDSLVIHQALYVVAKVGVADLLQDGPRTTTELARQLGVNESALYRALRALASRGIFEETSLRTFANTTQSGYLRTGVPGSVRSLVVFWGSEYYYGSFG